MKGSISRLGALTSVWVLVLSIMTAGLTPRSVSAAMSCDAFCDNTTSGIKELINDATCKSQQSCVDCVVNNLGQSQMATYCSGFNSTKKSNTKQVITTSLYVGTAATCITACALQASVVPATVAAGNALAKVCGGLGLATTAVDIIAALTANDMMGATMGALGAVGTVGGNVAMVKSATAYGVGNSSGKSLKALSKNPACMSGVIYAGLSAMKIASAAKMKKSKGQQCDLINQIGPSVNSSVMSCTNGLNPNSSTTQTPGLFAATSNSFGNTSLQDGLTELGSTATDNFVRDMAGDLKTAENAGVFSTSDLAKRIDAGEDLKDLLKSSTVPAGFTDMMADAGKKLEQDEKFRNASGMGGGYSAPSGGANLASNPGVDSMGFGASGVTPGSSATTLDIERKPASEEAKLGMDGDILHMSFRGTIFDLVSLKIKEQKGKYAELEPEARMNRVFNGYSDSKARKPASVKSK